MTTFRISAAGLAAMKQVLVISDRKHEAWDTAKAAIAEAERRLKPAKASAKRPRR